MKYCFLFLFIITNAEAALKVAIVDAFFCKELKGIKVVVKDMTGENDAYGKKCEDSRMYHGHKVAKVFLEHFKKAQPLELTLYKVFKRDGTQDPKALKAALADIEKEKMDATIMAIGFFPQPDFPKELPGLTLAASGGVGNGVKASDFLWPQMLETPKLVLFAHYFPSKTSIKREPKQSLEGHIDPSTMYLSKVDYLIPSPPNEASLTGSSYAVAAGSGELLRRCFPLKSLSNCVEKQTSVLAIKNSPVSKIFRTFN